MVYVLFGAIGFEEARVAGGGARERDRRLENTARKESATSVSERQAARWRTNGSEGGPRSLNLRRHKPECGTETLKELGPQKREAPSGREAAAAYAKRPADTGESGHAIMRDHEGGPASPARRLAVRARGEGQAHIKPDPSGCHAIKAQSATGRSRVGWDLGMRGMGASWRPGWELTARSQIRGSQKRGSGRTLIVPSASDSRDTAWYWNSFST